MALLLYDDVARLSLKTGHLLGAPRARHECVGLANPTK